MGSVWAQNQILALPGLETFVELAEKTSASHFTTRFIPLKENVIKLFFGGGGGLKFRFFPKPDYWANYTKKGIKSKKLPF